LALTSASSTATSLVYTWTADADAGLTGIKAESSSDGGTTWTTIGTLKPTVTTLTLTKLTVDHTYKVRLSAINAGGTSTASTAVAGTTLLLPPTGFAVSSVATTEVDLSWVAVTHATGYTIERSTDGKTFTALDTSSLDGTDTSFADSTPSAGTKYFYEIAGVDDAGTSAFAKSVSATTLLAAPASLAGTIVSNTEVDLSWTLSTATGLTGYKVEASTDGGSTYTTIGALKATAVSFNATGLKPNTTYTFRVSALNAGGASPSTVAKKTKLSAPVGLAAAVASKSEIDLTWTATTGATTYKVEQSSNGGTTWTDISPTGGSALVGSDTGLNVTGLTAGTSYSFRISATNAVGTSTPADAVSGMTLLDKPTGLAATAHGAKQINLSWTAVASDNLLGYELQVSLDGSTGWTAIAEIDPAATTATDTHLTTATEYFYRLIATDAGGDSVASDVAHATTA
jgi:titin